MNAILKSKSTRLLSALLAVLMIVAMLPTTAFAWSVEEGTKCTSTYGDHYVGSDGEMFYSKPTTTAIFYNDDGSYYVKSYASGNAKYKYMMIDESGNYHHVYCIEGGVTFDYSDTYNSTSGKNSKYFQNLPVTAQFGIMMALMYGYHEGMTTPVAGTNNDDYAFATQCIIWEYQQQLRTSPTSIASNNGIEAPMYIVENSHPAIISREMFNRAQEELSKRKARSPQSQKTAITASGKYSKYALTDVLICEECGSRYKRVTWTSLGQKRIVWRCVNRLDNGKKYCQHSPTLSEPALQEAIVRALNKFNDEDTSTYLTLMKATIGEAIGANGGSDEIDLLERRIDALNSRMLKMVSDSVERGADMEENEDEFKTISEQIEQLNRRIEAIRKSEGSDEDRQERLSLIQATIDQREANRDTYDDAIVRQMIECVKVHEGGKLTIIFGGGYEIEEQI